MKREDTNLELDAILRRATAQPPGPPTPDCADPEMLAAYYDRSLAEPDRDRLEAHFADCARCQAQLAAIVPSFLGNVPVLAFAGWNIAESVFWNRQHLEAMLRIMPFATLPFVLLALAFSMKQRAGFARQHAATN